MFTKTYGSGGYFDACGLIATLSAIVGTLLSFRFAGIEHLRITLGAWAVHSVLLAILGLIGLTTKRLGTRTDWNLGFIAIYGIIACWVFIYAGFFQGILTWWLVCPLIQLMAGLCLVGFGIVLKNNWWIIAGFLIGTVVVVLLLLSNPSLAHRVSLGAIPLLYLLAWLLIRTYEPAGEHDG